MSADTTDGRETPEAGDQPRRYAELSMGDDEFVIYDRQNHLAWIQSTVSVSVADHC